jgi:hypothetical protein
MGRQEQRCLRVAPNTLAADGQLRGPPLNQALSHFGLGLQRLEDLVNIRAAHVQPGELECTSH